MLIIFSPLEAQRHRPISCRLVAFFFFFSCCGLVIVVVMGVVVANGGGDCGWLLKFVMDVFIIILMSYLYYFNQIAKNIDLLMLNVKR